MLKDCSRLLYTYLAYHALWSFANFDAWMVRFRIRLFRKPSLFSTSEAHSGDLEWIGAKAQQRATRRLQHARLMSSQCLFLDARSLSYAFCTTCTNRLEKKHGSCLARLATLHIGSF